MSLWVIILHTNVAKMILCRSITPIGNLPLVLVDTTAIRLSKTAVTWNGTTKTRKVSLLCNTVIFWYDMPVDFEGFQPPEKPADTITGLFV